MENSLTFKSYTLTVLGAVFGAVLGPVLYLYKVDPTFIHEMIVFIGMNKASIIFTGIVISAIYTIIASILISTKSIKVNEYSLRNMAITVGFINFTSVILTILPSLML